MTTIKQWGLAVLLTLIAPMEMAAQDKLFTLEDLNYGGMNARQFIPENRYTAWWGDQLVRTDMEKCMLVDKQTGQETQLFDLEQVNQWTANADSARVHHFYYAQFPYADKPLVLLSNGKERMLVDWQAGEVAWKQTCEGETCEDWNAETRAVAYVAQDQLYIRTADNQTRQLTTDGSRQIVYGQSVHRNEFGIEKGTFWSADGRRLAFYRMDQSMVSDYPQVDTDAPIARHTPDAYPMAGGISHQVTIGVYDLASSKTVYLQTPAPPVNAEGVQEDLESAVPVYFSNISWSPDSKTLYVFELNRDQNDCRLVAYDAATGQRMKEIYRETHPKYVEPLHPIVFIPWNDGQFILQSQRDGYNHLFLCDTSGRLIRQLTKGPFVVMELLGFNEKEQTVIIKANKDNPIQANLYAVSTRNGRITPLDNQRGVHNGSLSADGQWLTDNYSEPDVPRKIDITPTSTHASTTVNYLTADDPWRGYRQPQFSCGTLKAADGVTTLYWRMVKPADFNPEKKYPTVVYVYGGPHAHNVQASWHYWSRSWETYMAQKGYIVFILDNRGSENRGRDFEQATFRQLGQVEMEDQMKGVEYLQSLSYVDQDRMGVHGWSFGGFMTITLMVNHPEVFKVGVAGGPVIDWKWYEVMYGERYMDTPQQNPEGYKKTSLLARAKDLRGKLQIITGMNDNTVVPQHCLSFLDACVTFGTQPDFFAYPGEPHNMRGHASVHLHERITQYFEDYLK